MSLFFFKPFVFGLVVDDTDMCLGVAVTPDEAAKSLVEFVDKDFGIEKTGTFWAPRGLR